MFLCETKGGEKVKMKGITSLIVILSIFVIIMSLLFACNIDGLRKDHIELIEKINKIEENTKPISWEEQMDQSMDFIDELLSE